MRLIAAAIQVDEFHQFLGVALAIDDFGNHAIDIGLVRTHVVVHHNGRSAISLEVIQADFTHDVTRHVTAVVKRGDVAAAEVDGNAARTDAGCIIVTQFTITTTKHIEHAATFNPENNAIHVGCVTAAEDSVYSVVTAMDYHVGVLSGNGVVGMVAATKHLVDGIVAAFNLHTIVFGIYGLVDIHIHIALRRAVLVVAAIHVAILEAGFAGEMITQNITNLDIHLAIHIGQDVGSAGTSPLAQAATVDATILEGVVFY